MDAIFVIPAKAGIQSFRRVMDSGFRRSDELFDFLRDHHTCYKYFNKFFSFLKNIL